MNDKEEQSSQSDVRIHILQPNRDLESNWAVDVAKNLEDYLLKICSGDISGSADDDAHHSVNFAEAALLLQGSIQVYSRKVEYLYTLVLHALDFLSQKRQEQQENTSVQPGESDSHVVADEENEVFLGLDDVPVEAKNCLDGGVGRDDTLNSFVKPPANLLVLEGDCLDTPGDAGELESYLLATNDLYQDFLLLDPCDAGAIDNFIKEGNTGIGINVAHKGSSTRSKTRKSTFQSPLRRSGGTAHKSNLGKGQDVNQNQTSGNACDSEVNDNNIWSELHVPYNLPEDDMDHGEELGDDLDDDDDDNDPWKPLNPYEPGDLKVKPYKNGKIFSRQQRNYTKRKSITSQFPLARIDGTISPEFAEALEVQLHARERRRASQSPPLYEKLRQSLIFGDNENCDNFGDHENDNDISGCENDPFNFDNDLPENNYMDTEEPLPHEKRSHDTVNFESNEAFGQEDPNDHRSLEDLCRSHLDALLASIAETEKQTELAARVSTWKQRIERSLEEQDSCPPFDIHIYGERVLEKLSLADSGGGMSLKDVLSSESKNDVSRTFSALLQLVNNRSVDIERRESSGESVCYTAGNPCYVRLLSHNRRPVEMQFGSSKKRAKSPLKKGSSLKFKSPRKSPLPNGKVPVNLGMSNGVKCTPEGKRRRRSQLIKPVDLQSAR